MPLALHNSLTRELEPLTPLAPPLLTMYTCGVTVYDDCHIGHARSLYVFDLMRRYFGVRGYQVKFIRNITDIDDKILNRARETNTPWDELVRTYIARYREDCAALGIDSADNEPRATENIPEMIAYIGKLIEKGYAYATSSGVYFNVRAFSGYGALSGQSVEQMLTGVRKHSDETKKDPLDFALWKISKPGEPFWDSPWGKGRPGWHIECSVMSQKYLGVTTLDIHAGGRDLIFPHHENEIAQAQALTGEPFARHWIHHGLLTINGQKMSKSLGNFVTIRDFLARYRNPDILKMFFLSAHYAHPIDYTEAKVAEAQASLERLGTFLHAHKPAASAVDPLVAPWEERFLAAMDTDCNTPQALAVLFDLVSAAYQRGDKAFFAAASGLCARLCGILGLRMRAVEPSGGLSDAQVEELIARRNQARVQRDFALSDDIRKELDAQGIIIEDGKGASTWRRKL